MKRHLKLRLRGLRLSLRAYFSFYLAALRTPEREDA